MDRIVVDRDTGVILTTLEEGDKIIRSKSVERLKETENWKLEDFSKINDKELRHIIPILNLSERAVFLSLVPYVSYKSCVIEFANRKDMNLSDIVKICGFSNNTVIDAIESLIKKDILYKGRNSKSNQYFMNPWLVHKGNTINKVLKEMFKNYRVRVKGNVKWKDL